MSDNIIDFLEQFNPEASISKITKTTNADTDTRATDYKYQAKGLLRAEKSASFDDFIDMVSKLVCLTMDDMNVEFLPDENQHVIISPDMKTDKTYITYRLLSRLPEREIKPMAREEIIEPGANSEEERLGTIYGQRFDCIVQFNIFASEYKTANKVMKNFEDMIFSFTGYMMSKGVQHILFKGQYTDSDFDIYRKSMSVRNLKYEIKIEDLIVVFKDKIESIITQGAL